MTGDFVCALGSAYANGTQLIVEASGTTTGTTNVLVDAVAPATPVPNPSNGTVFTGSAEANSVVHFTDSPPPAPPFFIPVPPVEICVAATSGLGVYTCTPTVPGPYSSVDVKAVDAAGNESFAGNRGD